ncbi:chemotaxis protein CheR, partial [Desulfovibrio aminophilus]
MSGEDRSRADPAAMPPQPSRVVAVGASAGGLEALRAFFTSLPPCPDMSFVVLQHLLPGRRSLLPEMLARYTAMPVREARDGAFLIPGEVLVLPPGMEMGVAGGRVGLGERDPAAAPAMPVDRFLMDLARDGGPRAVAVILSGAGGDGARGAAEVARAGGLVLVQSPESAAFDGMPRAALDTGAARHVLEPSELAGALLREVRGEGADNGGEHSTARFAPVFDLLTARHGVDFAAYKPTTVTRRIERRQAIRRCPDLEDYIRLLQTDRAELDQLHHDLLIGVTHFFRDQQAFACIEERAAPDILERAAGRDVRIWVPGCATGEEVYSLAMIFRELAETRKFPGQVRIFATDVHREALTQAARGLFTEESLRGAGRERTRRWFTAGDQGLRVHPELRRMVVFAEHDLVKDPPFTRMDLVACRNLLIYLQPFAQQRVLTLFHFALNPGGVLFLGPSESLGELEGEFEPLDRQWKIFTKRRDVRLPMSGILPVSAPARAEARSRPDLETVSALAGERVLIRHAPPALLLDERNRVLRAFGRTDLLGPRGPGSGDDLRDRLPASLRGPAAELLAQVRDGPDAVSYKQLTQPT